MLLRITGPSFVGGLVFERGRVVRNPSILWYMKGWRLAKVRKYARKRGWEVERVCD